MFLSWWKNDRRKAWLAQPQPPQWERWLERNVWQYRHLSGELQQHVREIVCVMFHEKNWEGGGNFRVTDEMRVAVAGQAALLTLGFEKPYYFDRLKSIILYSGSYEQRPSSDDNLLIGRLQDSFPHNGGTLLGESWQGGPIVLAWNVVQRDGSNARRRRSVVLHEFAHHMDSLDGSTDGSPPMTSYRFEKRWYEVTSKEYQQLLHFAQRKQTTLLDHYGATNHAEFFAVSTECFLTTPHEFAEEHADLFDVMVQFFGQDPREWMPYSATECHSA